METDLVSLIAASVAFVGSHFALSHPLRAPLVRRLGEKGFVGLYSLVALATLGWMVWAFRAIGRSGPPLWDGQGNAAWITASLLTLVATVLFAGSLKGNPAMPDTGADPATAQARGAFAVTRHPMMWSFALWAVAHILVAPEPRQIVLAGAILILALLGAHLQDRKKEAQMGAAWASWEARTRYWPRWSALPGAGLRLWLIAIIVWLLATLAHAWLAYVPAGVWRWLG